MTQAFPLQWPEGWTRTSFPKHSRFRTTLAVACSELLSSIHKLDAKKGSVVISTNIPVTRTGTPYSGHSRPKDCGVAVYWTTRTGESRVVACDLWREVHENIRAIGLAIDGMRAIKRAGASQILERAFTAFGALPGPQAKPKQPWWVVFGFPKELLAHLTLPMVEAKYKELAVAAHPDRGGSPEGMVALNQARDEAREHFK